MLVFNHSFAFKMKTAIILFNIRSREGSTDNWIGINKHFLHMDASVD